MTANQKELIAGKLSEIANGDGVSPVLKGGLLAAAHTLVNERESAVKHCPSEAEMLDEGWSTMEGRALEEVGNNARGTAASNTLHRKLSTGNDMDRKTT